MKLNAKVTDTHAGMQFSDKQRRVTLTIAEATSLYNTVKIPSDELRESTELIVLVMDKDDARGLFVDLENLFKSAEQEAPLVMYAIRLRDQLRPDPLPPWEQPTGNDDPERQFAQGGHGIQTADIGPLP